MTSLRITISPKERAAGRFISRVRRAIQRALAEKNLQRGLTQSDIARAIGVNRSVICREIRGHKDLTLSRVAEIAWALGLKPSFALDEPVEQAGNCYVIPTGADSSKLMMFGLTTAVATSTGAPMPVIATKGANENRSPVHTALQAM